jgi:hypothetical protein
MLWAPGHENGYRRYMQVVLCFTLRHLYDNENKSPYRLNRNYTVDEQLIGLRSRINQTRKILKITEFERKKSVRNIKRY